MPLRDTGDLVVVGRWEREELGRVRVVRGGVDSVEEDRIEMHVQLHRSTPAESQVKFSLRLTQSRVLRVIGSRIRSSTCWVVGALSCGVHDPRLT